MPSPFNADKSDLMRQVLEHLHVRFHPNRTGWQKVSCPGAFHARGDRNPSASVHLGFGKFLCHACGLHGDGFDLAQKCLDWDATVTVANLSISPESREVEEWIL